MPTFSIIIPTYNSAKTVRATMDSIVSQTFSDFEVCIIDGVSTDNTSAIIKEYMQKDKRIKWYSEKDKGIYDAMNKGIKKASGDWLFFIGSDDAFFDNEVLQKVHDQCQGYDVVYGNVYSDHFNGVYDGEFFGEDMLEKNICHQSIFYKKNIFNTIGCYDLKYTVWADWDHNMQWFYSKKIRSKFIDLIVTNYNANGFSALIYDPKFRLDRYWNYTKYNKHNLTLYQRLKRVKQELMKTYKLKNIPRLIRIIWEIPRRVI